MEYKIEINDEVKTVEVKDKQVILLLQGCPASGKSTFAEKLFQASKEHEDTLEDHKNKFVIVCRDDIRAAKGISQRDFSRENEVNKEEFDQAREILDYGYSLVVADTNLNKRYHHFWYELADEYGAEVQFLELYIPYAESVKRDKAREKKVGWRTIEKFYKAYYQDRYREEMKDKRLINESYDANKEDCVICDLDGTLALHQGRSPYEWNLIPTDKIDIRLLRLLQLYYNNGIKIVFLTGRPKDTYEATKKWLMDSISACGASIDFYLIMRDEKDMRKGAVTKKDLYETFINEHNFNTLCVFEDSITCTEMWRNLGLLTCQVANGEY